MNDLTDSTIDTFASYLAMHYIAKKGFNPGTVPEAEALGQECDIVLTFYDGMSMQLIGIVDREANPQKTFNMSRDALDQIGQDCLKYTGTVSGQKMPVSFRIIEVGTVPASEEDRIRLGALKRKSIRSKVILTSWTVDTVARQTWTNAPLGGFFGGKRFIDRLLRMPRVDDADLIQPEIVLARDRFPLLTVAMLATLAIVFAGEIIFGVDSWSGLLAPNIQTLVAFGGLNKTLVFEEGEWQRIFSSVLLHGGAVHLLMNGICLYLAGAVLESFVGRRWFFALFLIGGVSGSLMSLALNPSSVVSVGASGAIMGLLTAAFVCSFRFPIGIERTHIQMASLQILIPSLIPIAVGHSGQHIDYASHLGGALSGGLVGWVMLRTWLPASPRPAFLPMATAFCAMGTLAFCLSVLPVVRDYHTDTLNTILIPNEQLPLTDEEIMAKAGDLVARYPRDPRAHLYQAISLFEHKDLVGAERELRAGMAEREILANRFNDEMDARIRGMLALILNNQGNHDEAKLIAKPVCGMQGASVVPLQEYFLKLQLCEG